MEARIIGPASELGQFDTLDFFGAKLSRDWSKVDLNAGQLAKLDGNRFVETRGKASRAKPTDSEPGQSDEEVEEGLIRERLTELGVEVAPKASLKTLQGALDKAEKAKAKQDAEEAEILAEAERIQGQQSDPA